MQFSTVFTAASLIALARAAGNITLVTDITVTDFTTYCPEPTHFVVNNATITVSEATTITITGPCVIPTTIITSESGNSTQTITTQANGANKVAAGAVAGLAAIGAALF